MLVTFLKAIFWSSVTVGDECFDEKAEMHYAMLGICTAVGKHDDELK